MGNGCTASFAGLEGQQVSIPFQVVGILTRLEDAGFRAYIVGGCVRDMYLGREPKDWDITTSATPDEVKSLFDKVVPTGEKYGTVTVMMGSVGYEVTTMRRDGIYKDGRRPESVDFTDSIVEDLARRDLTINAVARDRHGNAFDPFDGIRDLNNGVIRAVGVPSERFMEDALRMMRVPRFAAQLAFSVEEHTIAAITNLSSLIRNVSPERIRDELVKILMSDHPIIGLHGLQALGLMDEILPEIARGYGFDQHNTHHIKDVFGHTALVVSASPRNITTRLAALFHDVAKPTTFTMGDDGVGHFYNHETVGAEMTEDILRRLKFDNDTVDRVSVLVREHMCHPASMPSVKRLMNRVGVDNMDALVDLQHADIMGQKPPHDFSLVQKLNDTYRLILEQKPPMSVVDLAINGHDLMGAGIPQGPRIGAILKRLREAVIEQPELNERDTLLEMANLD